MKKLLVFSAVLIIQCISVSPVLQGSFISTFPHLTQFMSSFELCFPAEPASGQDMEWAHDSRPPLKQSFGFSESSQFLQTNLPKHCCSVWLQMSLLQFLFLPFELTPSPDLVTLDCTYCPPIPPSCFGGKLSSFTARSFFFLHKYSQSFFLPTSHWWGVPTVPQSVKHYYWDPG